MPPKRQQPARGQPGTHAAPPAAHASTSAACRAPHPPPPPPSPALALPTELLTAIFSGLGAADLGRCACVAKPWRGVISREPACWALAIAELDPFCALGGPAGAERMARDAGSGCWLRAAALLAEPMQTCGMCDNAAYMLCKCNTRTRAAKAAAAASAGNGQWRCSRHCGSSAACSKQLVNRWRFRTRDDDTAEVHGDGSQDSCRALRLAINRAPEFSTIRITGRFNFYDKPQSCPLYLWKPLRIVGDGTAKLVGHDCPLYVTSPAVMLESLHVEMQYEDEGVCPDCGSVHEPEEPEFLPALQVRNDSSLIAERLTVNSTRGASVMLEDDSAACLRSCAISAKDHDHGSIQRSGTCLLAKSDTRLAMYGCTLSEALWGAFAGPEAARLLPLYNTFKDNAVADVTNMYAEDYSGHLVQPWHGAWMAHAPPP